MVNKHKDHWVLLLGAGKVRLGLGRPLLCKAQQRGGTPTGVSSYTASCKEERRARAQAAKYSINNDYSLE